MPRVQTNQSLGPDRVDVTMNVSPKKWNTDVDIVTIFVASTTFFAKMRHRTDGPSSPSSERRTCACTGQPRKRLSRVDLSIAWHVPEAHMLRNCTDPQRVSTRAPSASAAPGCVITRSPSLSPSTIWARRPLRRPTSTRRRTARPSRTANTAQPPSWRKRAL